MQRPQKVQFGFGWRRRLADIRCEPYRPSGVFDDLIARYAGVERSDDEFVGLDLGFHHAQISDNQRRTLGPQADVLTVAASGAVPKRCYKSNFLDKAAGILPCDDENFPAGTSNLRSEIGRASCRERVCQYV